MKLIRDKIPEIIHKNDAEDQWEITKCNSRKEKYGYLLAKLREETEELLQNPCIEEIADVLEVAYAIANELGYSNSDVEMCREDKKSERGGFSEGYLLTKKEKEGII